MLTLIPSCKRLLWSPSCTLFTDFIKIDVGEHFRLILTLISGQPLYYFKRLERGLDTKVSWSKESDKQRTIRTAKNVKRRESIDKE